MINLRIEPVYFNTDLSQKALIYLKEQKYLKFKKIKYFIFNNYIEKHPFGFIIYDQDKKICGFLGTMFSKRSDSKNNKFYFCNLHTWIVEYKYRIFFFSRSKEILKPIFNYDYIFFAKPVNSLIKIFERNFNMESKILKTRISFILNLKFFFKKKNIFKIILEPEQLKKLLNKNDLEIYLDKKNLSCLKFLLINEKSGEKIFIIAQTKRKKLFFNFFEILYISNVSLFKSFFKEASAKIFNRFKVLFLSQSFIHEDESCIPTNKKIINDFSHKIIFKNYKNSFKFNLLYTEFIY